MFYPQIEDIVTYITRFKRVSPQREPSSFTLLGFSHLQMKTLGNKSKHKFGVPPSPKIEGREEPRVSLPSLSYAIDKETKDSTIEQTIKKFGMDSMPGGKEYTIPCEASLLTQSSGLRAAGSSLRGFWH